MENATFEKLNLAKFCLLPSNGPQKGKFLIYFFITSKRKISYLFLYYVKGHRWDVMKNLRICRCHASCISRKLSKASQVKHRLMSLLISLIILGVATEHQSV